jgi:hypothetical protein
MTATRVTALVVVLLVVGCASAPPDRVALDTLKIAKATADSAMRVCADLYRQGKLTDAQKEQAILAYDKFAAAATTAAFALKAATTEGDANAIIVNATVALASLLDTLRAFGVKV